MLVVAVQQTDVVHDSDTVPQPVGSTDLDSLPDTGQTKCFARMNGHMKILAMQIVESIEMTRRRIPGFRSRDIEPYDSLITIADRQFSDLPTSNCVPHRREQGSDTNTGSFLRGFLASLTKSFLYCRNDFVECESQFQVLFRSVPDLRVDDVVTGQVDRALTSHADQALPGLHDSDCVLERCQIAFEGSRAGRGQEPRSQFLLVLRRQPMTEFLGQFEDGQRPQPAIQMIMKYYFWGPPDEIRHGRCVGRGHGSERSSPCTESQLVKSPGFHRSPLG